MGSDLLPLGTIKALPKIKLTKATCEKFGYSVSKHRGKSVQVANYRDPQSFEVVAQHTRDAKKHFEWVGNYKAAPLFGQWLWRDGGRRVVITEGEKDAMVISQLQDHKWPVVSIKSGSGTADRDLAENLEWLLRFDQVILCFDMDEPGRAAVAKCVGLFPPGRVYLANLPLKDAHEMFMAGRDIPLLEASYQDWTFAAGSSCLCPPAGASHSILRRSLSLIRCPTMTTANAAAPSPTPRQRADERDSSQLRRSMAWEALPAYGFRLRLRKFGRKASPRLTARLSISSGRIDGPHNLEAPAISKSMGTW